MPFVNPFPARDLVGKVGVSGGGCRWYGLLVKMQVERKGRAGYKATSSPSPLFLPYNRIEAKRHCHTKTVYTLPALPAWMISPVCLSSDLRTGHPSPSAFASVSSSFVPMILKVQLSGLMVPNSGMLV